MIPDREAFEPRDPNYHATKFNNEFDERVYWGGLNFNMDYIEDIGSVEELDFFDKTVN